MSNRITLPADRTRDQYRVHCFQIIGTDVVVFTAHERCSQGTLFQNRHSTIQRFDDTWYGTVYSAALPEEINKMPVGTARFDACEDYRRKKAVKAHSLILELFPELTDIYVEWDNTGEIYVSAHHILRLFPSK
jgi:hypothetical protein